MAVYRVTVTANGVFNRPMQLHRYLKDAFKYRGRVIREVTDHFLVLDDGSEVEFSVEENVYGYKTPAGRLQEAALQFELVEAEVDLLIQSLRRTGAPAEEALGQIESLREELNRIHWPDVEFPG